MLHLLNRMVIIPFSLHRRSRWYSEDMAAWIPSAYNMLGDNCDKKGHWISLVFLAGRGPDGHSYTYVYVFVSYDVVLMTDCHVNFHQGRKFFTHSRPGGAHNIERLRNTDAQDLAKIRSRSIYSLQWSRWVMTFSKHSSINDRYLHTSETSADDFMPVEVTDDDPEGQGISPPDLEHDSSFTKLAPQLSTDRIRAETSKYLTAAWRTFHTPSRYPRLQWDVIFSESAI